MDYGRRYRRTVAPQARCIPGCMKRRAGPPEVVSAAINGAPPPQALRPAIYWQSHR